jgi:hypothetical protein
VAQRPRRVRGSHSDGSGDGEPSNTRAKSDEEQRPRPTERKQPPSSYNGTTQRSGYLTHSRSRDRFYCSWRLGINPLTPPKPLGSNISFLHFRIYYSLVIHSMASSQNKPELNIARLPKLAKGLQRSNPLPTVLERLGFSNTSLRLRNDKKFCDFVIECNGVQFAVHRVVLCSRSEYFERMCSGEFKVFIPLSYFSCWC